MPMFTSHFFFYHRNLLLFFVNLFLMRIFHSNEGFLLATSFPPNKGGSKGDNGRKIFEKIRLEIEIPNREKLSH